MISTNSLKKAVAEIKNEHGAQYAEDCIKAMLQQHKINVNQYSECMNTIYA